MVGKEFDSMYNLLTQKWYWMDGQECLFVWCLTALSAQRYEVYHVGSGNNRNISCN